ncbi:MAG: DUF1189 family protein [Opitutales bacterium]|nr:DUF1189 family protein [Opitutales bacterium]
MNMISFFWRCLYDPSAYCLALREWKFKALAYFLLVSLAASIFSDICTIPVFAEFINREGAHISRQIPECEIGAGGFEIAQKHAVFVKLTSGKNFIAFTPDFVSPKEMEGLAMAFERDWISLNTGAGN